MDGIFNLENYKRYLINYYRYEIDNSQKRREERKEHFRKHYSDEFLKQIIDDTFRFIIIFLENNLDNQNGYCNFDLTEEPGYIYLNLSGGWFSDTLYTVGDENNQMLISLHLLQEFLGESFRIEQDYEVETTEDIGEDFNIYNEYYYPFIIISGDFSSLREKYISIKKQEQIKLVRTLKRKLEQDKVGVCN